MIEPFKAVLPVHDDMILLQAWMFGLCCCTSSFANVKSFKCEAIYFTRNLSEPWTLNNGPLRPLLNLNKPGPCLKDLYIYGLVSYSRIMNLVYPWAYVNFVFLLRVLYQMRSLEINPMWGSKAKWESDKKAELINPRVLRLANELDSHNSAWALE